MSPGSLTNSSLRLAAICSVAVFVFTSCFSRPGGHAGYQTHSYTVRGQYYQPMSVDDPLEHKIHSERYQVSAATLDACGRAKRVVAVGTTATRALESAATSGILEGRTRLFIHRGYDWKLVDLMITNFHLPKTTLLMMIDSFVGPRWRQLYEEGLAGDYRFLSFGDAMLLNRGL